ncbi:MAG: c-type cytochrome domain-containing protein [Limisphaerales bacterium]
MLPKLLIVGGASASIFVAVCVLAADKQTGYDTSLLPPAASKAGVTYASDVQPIFDKSCYPCHGPKTPKPKGGLRLDSLAAVLKGGKEGVVVVPGDIAKSPLMSSVAHLGDPDDYMPPPKNKGHIGPLTKEQIGLIRAWIEQGAK